jgi:hypothetical protein
MSGKECPEGYGNCMPRKYLAAEAGATNEDLSPDFDTLNNAN